MIKAQQMNALETLTDKINRSPEQPVTLADLKILLTEVWELNQWIENSNRILTSRINRIARKSDSQYVFGSNEGALRQELSELQKRQKQTETIISKITNRIG
jgi:hypothetical protein